MLNNSAVMLTVQELLFDAFINYMSYLIMFKISAFILIL